MTTSNNDSDQLFLVIAPPPTPNGDLHIGHLSGPYSAADIVSRQRRQQGKKGLSAAGTDRNQSYVEMKAEQTGKTVEEVAVGFNEKIQATLAAANINFDIWTVPTQDSLAAEITQETFRQLYEDGHIVAREVDTLHCEASGRYPFEAYAGGICPHCGTPSNGTTCENCGKINDSVDLIDPVCNSCPSTEVTKKKVKRFYFPLEPFRQKLIDFYSKVNMNGRLKSFVENVLSSELPDMPVSHITDYGIPVPLDGFENQKIFSWFELACFHYEGIDHLSRRLSADKKPYNECQINDDMEMIYCFGFDNTHHYVVFFPAVFMASRYDIKMPDTFMVNEFYQLDHAKFSTSRNHAIWGKDLLKEAPADLVRLYLSHTRPETEQTNFTLKEFNDFIANEIQAHWQPWLTGLSKKVQSQFAGQAPAAQKTQADWLKNHKSFLQQLDSIIANCTAAFDSTDISTQRLTRQLCELVRISKRFSASEGFLFQNGTLTEEYKTAVALELSAAQLLAKLSWSIMPDFASYLLQQLGTQDGNSWPDNAALIPASTTILELKEDLFAVE